MSCMVQFQSAPKSNKEVKLSSRVQTGEFKRKKVMDGLLLQHNKKSEQLLGVRNRSSSGMAFYFLFQRQSQNKWYLHGISKPQFYYCMK